MEEGKIKQKRIGKFEELYNSAEKDTSIYFAIKSIVFSLLSIIMLFLVEGTAYVLYLIMHPVDYLSSFMKIFPLVVAAYLLIDMLLLAVSIRNFVLQRKLNSDKRALVALGLMIFSQILVIAISCVLIIIC